LQLPKISGEQLVVLNMLMRIEQLSADATSMRKSVVSIMAEPSLRWVRSIVRQFSMDQKPILVFMAHLTTYGTFRRTLTEPFQDLDTLVEAPGSLKGALKSTIQSLVSWSTFATVSRIQSPPNYDPHLIHVALKALGTRTVLSLMLDEIKSQSSSNTGVPTITIDVVASLVCMPTPGSCLGPTDWVHTGPSERNGGMSLREALRNEYDEAPKTIRINARHTEAVIRLHRRVEAQLTIPLNDGMNDLAAQAIITDLGDMTANEAAAAAVASAAVSGDQMDFTITGSAGNDLDLALGMSMDLSGDLDLHGGNEDDIFAGLSTDGDMNFDDW
jgi:mediator of RNA polymerase II transcription subunit 5